jgi:lipoate-protein ligase B
LGRATDPLKDLTGWSGETVDVQRGGRATYHGPGQIVGYPILDLRARGSDLHRYLRDLENVIIRSLAYYGVEADGNREDATGVWIGPKKIASIGIGVKRWISFHGFAINLHRDPLAFTGIRPCGFSASDMVSLEDLVGQKIPRADFQAVLRAHFI